MPLSRSKLCDGRKDGARARVALVAAVSCVFVLLVAASAFLGGPQVEVDEGSYLLSAAAIAGRVGTTPVYGYYSGYSLLISPAFLLATAPVAVYHAVLVINAFLIASTPVAIYRLTRTIHQESEAHWHVVSAVGAGCYSSVLLISQYAMSDNALVAIYAWMLAAGAMWMRSGKLISAILCGALAGSLYLIHPRGIAMAAPVLVVLTIFGCKRPGLRASSPAIAVAAMVVAGLHIPLEHLAAKPSLEGGYSLAAVLGGLRTPDAMRWVVVNFIGALSEAIVTSLGVVSIGVMALLGSIFGRSGSDRVEAVSVGAIAVAMLLTLASTLAVTAIFFIPPHRADQIAYGRYALPAMVPIIAMGLLRLTTANHRRKRDGLFAVALGLASAVVMGYVFAQLPESLAGKWNYVNAPALFLAERISASVGGWMVAGGIFVLAASILYITLMRDTVVGLAAFFSSQFGIAAMVWCLAILPASRYYASERAVVNAASEYTNVTGRPLCLYLSSDIDAWNRIDLFWRLQQWAFLRPAREPSCIHGLIDTVSGKQAAMRGMEAVATERPSPLGGEKVGFFLDPDDAANLRDARQRARGE